MCDVQRLSLAGHYSALSCRTLLLMSVLSVCITSCMHCITIIRPLFILFYFIYHTFSFITNARLCGLLYLAGAHIQANEK